MSINTAFYQIAEDVTAADLARIIGATDLCGPDQIVISDIEPFDAAKPFSLIYQSDPDLAKTLAVESAVVITNEACLPFIDRANCCLVRGITADWVCPCVSASCFGGASRSWHCRYRANSQNCRYYRHSPLSDHHAASCDRGGNL
jgi:hypothetical protein